jgi:hypothetical protein
VCGYYRASWQLQSSTPLFVIGDLAAGIWPRVPPPYDVTANRNAAANPLAIGDGLLRLSKLTEDPSRHCVAAQRRLQASGAGRG